MKIKRKIKRCGLYLCIIGGFALTISAGINKMFPAYDVLVQEIDRDAGTAYIEISMDDSDIKNVKYVVDEYVKSYPGFSEFTILVKNEKGQEVKELALIPDPNSKYTIHEN